MTGTVSGGGPKPTGTVTLTGGGYTSPATTLSGGNYSITIPANSLALGADTLTVNYSGDNIYNTSTNTAPVTVPGFTLSATPLSFTAGAATGNASTVTVTPVGGYTGTITLTAAVTAAPAGAVSAPTFTGQHGHDHERLRTDGNNHRRHQPDSLLRPRPGQHCLVQSRWRDYHPRAAVLLPAPGNQAWS